MATAAIAGSESSGAGTTGRRNARQKLSRERVEKAAISVARSEGFGALSIRNVAKVLGVAPMALYTHVKNKDELAEHVADALIGAIDSRTLGALTWQDRVRTLLRAHRGLILKHPDIAPYIASGASGQAEPGATRFNNAVTGVLTQAGFDARGAQDLYFTLMTYNYGSAVTASASTGSANNLLKYNEGLSAILAAYESRMMRPALGLVESMRERLRFGRK
jgi:AcrR family transcriptional regulator